MTTLPPSSSPAEPAAQPGPFTQAGSTPQPAPQSDCAAQPGPTPQPGTAPSAQFAAPGTDLASDLGAALRFAGNALLRNPAAYLVSGLIYFLAIIVISVIAVVSTFVVLLARADQWIHLDAPPVGEFVLAYAVMLGVLLLAAPISLLWESGAGRAAEIVREGGRPTVGQAMVGPMRIILTALLVAAMVLVGSLLFILPGMVLSVMLFYAIPAAARGASPVDAVKQSFRLVKENLATTLVAWLVMSVIGSFAGSFVFPLVISIPFYILFQLGMFERLNGRELPEPAAA